MTQAAERPERASRRTAPVAGRTAELLAPGRAAVRSVTVREPGPGEVLIRVEGCGVCGSNVPVWEGRPWFEYPLGPGRPGHEGWGEVVAVGDGVDRVRAGARVAMLSQAAFAEYDLAPADQVVPLPEALRGQAFPGEAVGCAVNVFRRAGIEPGSRVAVVGVGFLGALLVQLATRAGAQVVALSRRATSLEAAWGMGADVALPLDGDRRAIAAACDHIGGQRFDVVVEAAGVQATLDVAAELVRERGRLVVAGYHQDGMRQVNLQMWNWRGIDVVNAHERDPRVYVRGIEEAAHAVAQGQLQLSPLLSHAFPMDRVGDALEATRTRPPGFMKAVVTM